MTCNILRSPSTLDSKILKEYERLNPGSVLPGAIDEMEKNGVAVPGREVPGRIYDELRESKTMFLCGDITIEICGRPDCGYPADYLCDYPVGDGKTCDLNLCEIHNHAINTVMDLCPIHIAEYRAKTGSEQVELWPPAQ